jgi:hypothetical protein
VDRRSLAHLVRNALSGVVVNVEHLRHAVEVLDMAVAEMAGDASPDELRRCGGTLRAGVLQALVSLIGVNGGIGAVEFAADVWTHIESEEPLD